MGKKYLEEEDEMINRMSNEGDDSSEIARVLNYNFGRNRTTSGIGRRMYILKNTNQPKTKRKYERYSDAEIRAIMDLDAVGMPRKQIAETVSTSFSVNRSDSDIAQKIKQLNANTNDVNTTEQITELSVKPLKEQDIIDFPEVKTASPIKSSSKIWSEEEILFVRKYIKSKGLVQPLGHQKNLINDLTKRYNNKFGSFRSEAAMYARVYVLTDKPKKKKKSLLKRWREWRVKRLLAKTEKLRRKL
jgi:hypothetical protein